MNDYQFVSLYSDLLIAIAAIVTAGAAIVGLNNWQKQLKGSKEYDLARRLMIGVLKYRDAIQAVRNPYVILAVPDDHPANQALNNEQNFDATRNEYDRRFKFVEDIRYELYADTIEAGIIWGDTLTDLLKKLSALDNEISIRVDLYLKLKNPKNPDENKVRTKQFMDAGRDVLYDVSIYGTREDEFTNELEAVIDEIRKFLGPKIGK